ncbi:hypothetical protein M9Y10_036039 [Tritrichomonas musculus]|uniref:C2 domain-containing protein n=1 Tax=Tritrichomonas musculus TaxID=1915356 RepID=A0ABR2GVZ1_9EUKA
MLYTLHVRVIEADDIPKMDANATDAYCILNTSSESRNTAVIQNSMHPRWNQEFHFSIATPTTGSLRIVMRDKDIFKDDNISSLDIQLCSLPLGQVIDRWYDMIPFRRVKKGGRLHLVLHMAQTGQPPFIPSSGQPGYATQAYPQPGYAAPAYPQPAYGAPPPAYPQPAYGAQPPAYPPRPAYGAPPPAYPQPAYGAPPPAYPPGYAAPPPAYPQPAYGAPPPGYPAYPPPPGYPPRY